ncbi:MAG: putative DNA binding domain-containing protein [Candidatus Azobacteroides sp.]|nr:putative DNA binding domain-containing protein [Candidatus Azobacteroides sp.]
MLNDELSNWLKEGESERLAFRLFFGHETIETLTAFANSHGGVLLLGISELKEIKGIPDAKENINQWFQEIHTRTTPRLLPHIELIEIEEKIVVYISVAEYPVKPVAFEGRYYKRSSKSTRELSVREAIDFRKQTIDSGWDTNSRPNKTITDLSFRKLYRQIERISRKKQCPPEEPLTFLRKYGLAEGDAITNACWLLFLPGEESETAVELGRFSSPTVTSDTLTLKTDLFTEAEETMRFICKHIGKETQADEPVQWQYPLEAVRELVVNMIIHRDYNSDYNSIIKIFDGYIEFYNSGALPDDLSIKQLSSNGYISRPRNRQIAELFKDAGMFDEYGSGIRQICTAFVNCGLRPPEFIKLPGRLIVRVFGDTSPIRRETEKQESADPTDTVDDDFDKADDIENIDNVDNVVDFADTESTPPNNSSDRERRILALIIEDNRIPLNEIALKLAVSKRTVLRDIKKMKKEKILERIGSEKTGHWKINPDSLS